MSPSLYPNGNKSVLHLFWIQVLPIEPEQNVLSSQSSINLCESLSTRLFAIEQGLPSGDVPGLTGIMSEPQRYAKTRTCDDESGRSISAREVMGQNPGFTSSSVAR